MNNIYYYYSIFILIQGFIILFALQYFYFIPDNILIGKIFIMIYIIILFYLIRLFNFTHKEGNINKFDSNFDSFNIQGFERNHNKGS